MTNQKVKRMESVEAIEIMPPDIKNLIYEVRNKQVMVDSDLAILYQVETKALNRAVKRNIKLFSEDFCFQLTTENARVRKKGWTRRQTYITICIHRTRNIHASQCIT